MAFDPPDALPHPTALIGADGTLLAADAGFLRLAGGAWSQTPQRRRLLAAVRLAARRGSLTLRLTGPLAGWTASCQAHPDGVAATLSDAAGRLETAVNDLLLTIAADAEGFCRIDRQGRWAWLSPRLQAPTLIGRPTPRAAQAAARMGRPIVDLVVCPPREDGAVWLLTARPQVDARGRPDGLVGVLRSGLRCGWSGGAAARLEMLARAIDPGFALYDEDGRLRLASDAYSEAFDADGWRFPLGAPEPDWSNRIVLGEALRPTLGEELRFEVATAECRRLSVRRAGLPCGGWVESLSDVTATRKAQAADAEALNKVRRTERAKQAFMEAVGIELFTAAAKVRASLRAIARTDGGAMAVEFTAMMNQGLRRLFATARDVRAFSLLENRDARLETSEQSLADLIHQTAAGRLADADRTGATMRLHTPTDARRRIDPAYFALALDHLLSNAVKFGRPGGHIDVSLQAPDGDAGEAMVTVMDDGVGVSADSLDRIQTPFVQGDEDAARRSYEGAGLGLAICRAVMRLHGGRLEITGAPNQGVTARLILPSDHPASPVAAPPPEPPHAPPLPDPRLFARAAAAMAVIDAAGVVQAVNAAAEGFFARTAAEMVGRPLAALLAPGAPPLDPAWPDGWADRPWRTGDGDLWARATATATPTTTSERDGRGGVGGGWVIGWEDVADLCRLAEMAQEERKRLIDAAADVRDWFWSVDATQRYNFISSRFQPDGPDARGDRLGAVRPATTPPADPAHDSVAAAAHRADIAAHRPFVDFIERYRRPDGAARARRVAGSPLFDARGRFEGYVGIVEQANEVEDLRQVDRAHAARLRVAFESAPFGLILWDEDGRLLFWNRRYAKILPQLASRLRVGMTVAEAAPLAATDGGDVATTDPAAWTAMRLALRDRPSSAIDVPLADGRWSQWSDRRAESGAMIGVRVDVSHRKKAERRIAAARAAAEQADVAKRNFLAVISHELRTPLNAVIGFAELLRMPGLDGGARAPAAQAAAEAILRNGRRLQSICDQIIDYVRIESGDYPLHEGRAALADVLRRVAGDGVRIDPPQNNPVLRIDPDGLARAALSAAAALADHHPGPVRARGDWLGDVVIELTPLQDGAGDGPQYDGPLYDPDSLAATATARVRTLPTAAVLGEGLGLAVARGLMRAMGGDLTVSQTANGGPMVRLSVSGDRVVGRAAP